MTRPILSFLGRARPGRALPNEVREDVLAHLQHMCRTRRGSSPTAPGYGLPDLTSFLYSSGEIATLVVRALTFTIETYEPRLRSVRVEHIPGEAWDQLLRFSITGQLGTGHSAARVKFSTRIDPSRRVTIE